MIGDDDVLPQTDVPRRRGRPVVLAVVVVAALAGGGMVVAASGPAADQGDVTPGAFRPAERTPEPRRQENCDNSWDSGTAAEVPDELRYVPTVVPDGRVMRTDVSVQRDHLGCHVGSESLVLAEIAAEDSDRVVRTVSLRGPSYRAPGPPFLSERETVAVRGGQGTWTGGWLSWTESDGGTWELTGTASQAEMLEIAEQLSIDLAGSGPPAQLAEVPAPFRVLWQRPQPEDRGFNEDWSWYVRLEPPGGYPPESTMEVPPPGYPPPVAVSAPPAMPGMAPPPPTDFAAPPEPQTIPLAPRPTGPARMQVVITRMSTPVSVMTQAVYSYATLTSVGGRPAVLSISQSGERQTSLSWDQAPGVQASVTVWDSPVDLEELRSIAESLELAAADDHRFE